MKSEMGEIEDFIFFDIIKPSIERYGLRPIESNELLVAQGPLMDNIRTTILQSRFIMILDSVSGGIV
ncbi:MAG TPA: hypothetical protein VEH06_14680 [Candidatus Bathyarchaeia archaeon]|jgi:hypothetical protein|nr:hypothetical protein [Candidatus Bathyarchaeia archaeon]